MSVEELPGSVDLVLHVVTRKEWRAEKPVRILRNRHPLKLAIDHFTYTDPCYTYEECVKAVQDMQKDDKAKGLWDIKYNFLVGGDGGIYEGRGWHISPSRELKDIPYLLRRRLDIAYIGDFTGQNIPQLMILRKLEILDFGIKFDLIKRFHNSLSVRKEGDTFTLIGPYGRYPESNNTEEENKIIADSTITEQTNKPSGESSNTKNQSNSSGGVRKRSVYDT